MYNTVWHPILGSHDFFGVNIYTSVVVKNNPNPGSEANYFADAEIITNQDCANWTHSGSNWLK